MLHTQFILLALIITINHTISIVTNGEVKNTLRYLHILQKRFESNIDLLNNHFPQIYSNLYSNIHDKAAKSNIPNIISSLQNQITDSSQCGSTAKDQISRFAYSAKADINHCVEDALSKTGNLAAQAASLLQKASGAKNEVVGRIGSCVKGNLANEVALALCLVAQIYPIEESLGALEQEIELTLGIGEQTAQIILTGLSECLVETESISAEKSNNINKDYQECIYLRNSNGK